MMINLIEINQTIGEISYKSRESEKQIIIKMEEILIFY